MKLDPISLRLFVAVMETGTIAAAAAREHIATAAASRRISELEGALSAVLFARSNKGTEPTAATPPKVAAAQKKLAAMQWAVPALTGALTVVSSYAGEQQRAAEQARGVRQRLLG